MINKELVKSTLNSDHVVLLASYPDKQLFMIVNPAQDLISYKVCSSEDIHSVKEIDRAIEMYNDL